uniref:PUL domain-containing protein n=1 Tax=Arcella intermedia TaxID=1963864 RepID=A0A6B2KXB5_9EUKA
MEDEIELFQYQLLSLFGVELGEQSLGGVNLSNPQATTKDAGLVPGQTYSLTKKVNSSFIDTLVKQMSPIQQQQQQQQQLQRQMQQLQVKPRDQNELNMQQQLRSHLAQAIQYEDPNLQKKALEAVPVAELKALAEQNPMIGPKEDFIVQLLRWFKTKFFTWTNDPPCQFCKKKCNSYGSGTPTAEDLSYGASRVEVYQCTVCSQLTRFPRYNYSGKLLETRTGRCGEWANCFTLLCRALGYEARLVFDWTDHVWTEVYSQKLNRWIHCDSCEAKFDAPLLYESGWGKKLSYVIAFSAVEVVDVTKRYTLKYEEVRSRRNMVSEEFLKNQIDLINQQKGAEISGYSIEMCLMIAQRREEEIKNMDQHQGVNSDENEGRTSGSLEWRTTRGEMGAAKPPKIVELKMENCKPFFQFQSFTSTSDLNLVGTANLTKSLCQLTPARNDCVGALWYKQQIDLSKNWKTSFVFHIGPARGADGLAFVIQNSKSGIKTIGSGGSGKGYQNIEKSLAVEIDTYENWQETEDPNGNHISIHTRGTEPNSAHHSNSLSVSKYSIPDFVDGFPHGIIISYKNRLLQIFLDDLVDPVCEAKIDLSQKLDSTSAWIGFTAATGGINQFHNILNWTFYYESDDISCSTNPPSQPSKVPYQQIADKTNFPGMTKKLVEFNTLNATSNKYHLNSTEIEVLKTLMDTLQNTAQYSTSKIDRRAINIIEKILNEWDEGQVFPVIDLLRLCLAHPDGVILISQYGKFCNEPNIASKILKFLTGSFSAQLVSLKFITNSFERHETREHIGPIFNEIIQKLKICAGSDKKPVLNCISTLFINCCIFITENTSNLFDGQLESMLEGMNQLLADPSNDIVIMNVVYALSTLISNPVYKAALSKHAFPSLQKCAKDKDMTEIIETFFLALKK